MMILGIEIMRLDGPRAAAGGWAQGDVVRVFEAPAEWLTTPPATGMPRTGYVIITDFPGTLEKARAILETEAITKPLPATRQVWQVDWAALKVPERNKLEPTGGVLVTTWASLAAGLVKHKVKGIKLTILDVVG